MIEHQARMHSTDAMREAGFRYTGIGDTVCCDTCGLKVSGWTSDMKPLVIHAQRSSTCSFILSKMSCPDTQIPLTFVHNSVLSGCEESFKKPKTVPPSESCSPLILKEVDTMKTARRKTFQHWPPDRSPSSTEMIEAGFFNCNVGDRVICIYCKIVCQQWTWNADGPWEIHRTVSPNCPYVIASSKQRQMTTISIPNGTAVSVETSLRSTFVGWLDANVPSIDDFVEAGFFYTGTQTIVTCFYCNGSLQNWGLNDNPMVEHARWFPNCQYAKQLCEELSHRNIQASRRGVQGIWLLSHQLRLKHA